jgi:PAS domain S-box-containing protein
MNEAFSLDVSALSNFELAVLRFTTDGRCVFANTAADRLLGKPGAVGLTLDEIYPDAAEREFVASEMARRLSGQASTYRTTFTRPHSGERVPISVFAFPETDPAGEIIGSIAIVRDLREEMVARGIHRAVETLPASMQILEETARQLHELIPFDVFRVTAISRGRKHLRSMFSTDAHAVERYPLKWWPIPAFILSTIDVETARIIDIDEMFEQPTYRDMARNDPAVKAFRRTGVRASLSVPILQGDRVAAFIALDAKALDAFDQESLALCQRLPLTQAVLAATHFEELAKLNACIDLVRELGAKSSDVRAVASTLTQALATQFGWDHVAVFQHDEDVGAFRLLSQASSTEVAVDPARLLPCDRGILARAFRERVAINVSDNARQADAECAGADIPDMASTLAVPIPGETRRWVLQVASRLQMAFAEEEIDTLRLLAAEAGHILERAALLEMRDAILQSINDAVIETDRRGTIRKANPAAERLLGIDESALAGHNIEEFIADPALAAAVVEMDRFSCRETELLAQGHPPVSVLLSGSPLPENLGGRVFVASDMTYEREVQRLGALKDVFRNASLECRIPLALAASWVGQLQLPQAAAPAIDRALKQIRKADLPLERLLRLAMVDGTPRERHGTIDLNVLVSDILQELPESDQVTIELRRAQQHVLVDAPREGLRFCIESALSFALRTKPQDKTVSITVTVASGKASIFLSGDWIPDFGLGEAGGIRQRWRRQTLSDLALATGEIETILTQAHGRFSSELDRGVKFEMEMPLAAQE